MLILAINSGSSSIKFSVFESQRASSEPRCLYEGELSEIGTPSSSFAMTDAEGRELAVAASASAAKTPQDAVNQILRAVCNLPVPPVGAVGYRVVHPGPKLDAHQRITEAVLSELEKVKEFAPLHDPADIAAIRAGMEQLPEAHHYACFDTVFHQTMPVEATTYPLPESLRAQGIRRYGFHGLSCESIVHQFDREAGGPPRRMVIAHLGSGCSVTAVVDGKSVDTTMGMTPTGGVIMGTRSGDLDPGVLVYLMRKRGGNAASAAASIEAMLNRDSGMVALSGMANDVKAIRQEAAAGNARAILALRVFTRSVRKAIGSYCWLLGGLDAIVFAGGIGEHDPATRSEILEGLDALGTVLDDSLNSATGKGMRRISAGDSATAIHVVPSQEDLAIARNVIRMSADAHQ